jgi:hypothetical protein
MGAIYLAVDIGERLTGASHAAFGLFVKSVAWSNRYATGRTLPRSYVAAAGAKPEHALELVAIGLWAEDVDGWRIVRDDSLYRMDADVDFVMPEPD